MHERSLWIYFKINEQFTSITPDFDRELSWGMLLLTQVLAVDYKLRLILSYDWFEFQRLNTICGWIKFRRLDMSCSRFCPAADSSFGAWIRVAADSILGWIEFRCLDTSHGRFHSTADSSSNSMKRVAAYSILWLIRFLVAGYELRLIPPCRWLQVMADFIS